MTRRKTTRHTPAEHLARLLRDATIAAYVAHNPTHDAPEWTEAREIGRQGFQQVAAELLKRGVRPPLEDQPERVEWIYYEDYVI